MKAESKPDDRLMIDKKEVSRLLSITIRTLDRKIKAGSFLPPERIGGLLRWSRLKLRRWIDAGCPAMSDWEGRAA